MKFMFIAVLATLVSATEYDPWKCPECGTENSGKVWTCGRGCNYQRKDHGIQVLKNFFRQTGLSGNKAKLAAKKAQQLLDGWWEKSSDELIQWYDDHRTEELARIAAKGWTRKRCMFINLITAKICEVCQSARKYKPPKYDEGRPISNTQKNKMGKLMNTTQDLITSRPHFKFYK